MNLQTPKADSQLPSRVERSVTLLGATGSIGASTIDLIKREPARYPVEAVTANKNAAALAALARELNARFAAVGDPGAYGELNHALSGTGIAAGAGPAPLIQPPHPPPPTVLPPLTAPTGPHPTPAP